MLMEGHNAWLKKGFDDGVFLLSGSIRPSAGGGIIAQAKSLAELKARVDQDPFVAESVVSAEIVEITPALVDERLTFLKAQEP